MDSAECLQVTQNGALSKTVIVM